MLDCRIFSSFLGVWKSVLCGSFESHERLARELCGREEGNLGSCLDGCELRTLRAGLDILLYV